MAYINISTFKIESLVLLMQKYLHKEIAGTYSIIFLSGKKKWPFFGSYDVHQGEEQGVTRLYTPSWSRKGQLAPGLQCGGC